MELPKGGFTPREVKLSFKDGCLAAGLYVACIGISLIVAVVFTAACVYVGKWVWMM